LVWIVVFAAFGRAVHRLLKVESHRMRFSHERPGQLAAGLISGLLAASALSMALVMMPPIEGAYFFAQASPIGELNRRGVKFYCGITFGERDPLTEWQMRAGYTWLMGRLGGGKRPEPVELEEFLNRFESRYTPVMPETEKFSELRNQLQDELRAALRKKENGIVPVESGGLETPPRWVDCFFCQHELGREHTDDIRERYANRRFYLHRGRARGRT
jgi:hypothetical protein